MDPIRHLNVRKCHRKQIAKTFVPIFFSYSPSHPLKLSLVKLWVILFFSATFASLYTNVHEHTHLNSLMHFYTQKLPHMHAHTHTSSHLCAHKHIKFAPISCLSQISVAISFFFPSLESWSSYFYIFIETN